MVEKTTKDGGNSMDSMNSKILENTEGNLDGTSTFYEPKKPSNLKRNILIALSGIILVTALVVLGLYYSNYSSAKKVYEDAEKLFTKERYGESYNAFLEIKDNGKIKKFRTLSEEQIDTLYNVSKDRYVTGAITYSNDDDEYSATRSHYVTYSANFGFDATNTENAQRIITYIDEYNEANKAFYDLDKYTEMIKVNRKFVDSLSKYIREADEMYEMAYKGINNNVDKNISDVASIWYRNSDYYYDMIDDIDSVKDENIEYTFFTVQEYQTIREYILASLYPCEVIYNIYFANKKYSESDQKGIRNNWSIRNSMKNEVESMVSGVKSIITYYDSNYSNASEKLEDCRKKLKNQFIDIPSTPNNDDDFDS